MHLKKAKTPRRNSKKKQGSVKRAGSIKRQVSVRRGGRSSAPRSKSSRRLIRGGGKKINIALGTGIAAIGGSYMYGYYDNKKVKNWYKKTFRSWEIVSEYLHEIGISTCVISKLEFSFDKLPQVMGEKEILKFYCIKNFSNLIFTDKFANEVSNTVHCLDTTSSDVDTSTTSGDAAGVSVGNMDPVVAPTNTIAAACKMDSDEEFLLYVIMVRMYDE